MRHQGVPSSAGWAMPELTCQRLAAGRNGGGVEFVRVEADGAVVGAGVPVVAVAAVAAAAGLGAAYEAGGAVVGDAQGPLAVGAGGRGFRPIGGRMKQWRT